jgi:glyoxylase-like metal-dependent hydrolase (beta-lactamase superfamily II)
MQVDTLDLRFQSTPHVIAAFLVRGNDGGNVLIETGPGSTLPTLIEGLKSLGLEPADIRHVLVTHIHLDHAGAAGWWAQQGATVYVHPIGAPHLIDPSKLLSSATRIYGDRMGPLWGEVLPAPANRVVKVEDGEILDLDGLEIEAIATPGHAYHHHVYRVGDVAFTGDAAGVRLPGMQWIDLPAPPPEFNLEAWRESLERLRRADLRTLYRTHFGAVSVDGETANQALSVERFTATMRAEAVALGLGESELRAYELANPRVMSVDGMTRYWRKRAPKS